MNNFRGMGVPGSPLKGPRPYHEGMGVGGVGTGSRISLWGAGQPAPFFLESTFIDQNNPKRQTADPPLRGSPKLDLSQPALLLLFLLFTKVRFRVTSQAPAVLSVASLCEVTYSSSDSEATTGRRSTRVKLGVAEIRVCSEKCDG
jgi:hypothetical protein